MEEEIKPSKNNRPRHKADIIRRVNAVLAELKIHQLIEIERVIKAYYKEVKE